ncbi:MAG TPA: hypothetical protein VFU21_06750 [Kofleriaceae bacterium]|nr:hypothetical protein [Kofleriaceae bacterium]
MNDVSPQARRIIDLGRDGQGPTAVQRERVRAGVAAGVAALGVTAAASSAAAATAGATTAAGATTTGSLLGIKVAIATVVAVGAGVGGASVAMRASAPPAEEEVREISPAAARPRATAPVAVPALERPLAIVEETPPERVRVPEDVNRRPEAGHRKPEVGTTPSPESPLVLSPTPNPQPPTPPDPEPEPAAPKRTAPALDETELLAIATDASRRKDYPSVLAATAMHAARYLRSSRALDRDALRAVALCQTGRRQEGRFVLGPARRWLARPPARVNEILAACDVPREDE